MVSCEHLIAKPDDLPFLRICLKQRMIDIFAAFHAHHSFIQRIAHPRSQDNGSRIADLSFAEKARSLLIKIIGAVRIPGTIARQSEGQHFAPRRSFFQPADLSDDFF